MTGVADMQQIGLFSEAYSVCWWPCKYLVASWVALLEWLKFDCLCPALERHAGYLELGCWTMILEDAQALITEAQGSLYRKGAWEDMLKLRILIWDDYLDLSRWPQNVIIGFFVRGREMKTLLQMENRLLMEQSRKKLEYASFDNGGREHDPRNAAAKVAKARKRLSP